MDDLKCECGHVNPEGTVLCEACGKPVKRNQHIDGNDQKKLLNMRYEGSARRSNTYRTNIIDKIWRFFSSVKVGVYLILFALIASGVGTIFPQEMYIPEEAENRDPAVFYEDWYGIFGKIYYQLGFHKLYESWWYLLLIALIGVSLVICSLDRFIPLRRALKMQKPKRHVSFLKRQRLFSLSQYSSKKELELIIERLKKQGYKITNQDNQILAEKNRFSRWGPYVNHIGLIIILIGAILRISTPLYLDDYLWIREGEKTVIPSTDNAYFIESEQFILEQYDPNDPQYKKAMETSGELVDKNYQTDLIIYHSPSHGKKDDLEPIKTDSTQMNKPVKFSGFTLYQSGYQLDEFSTLTLGVTNQTDEKQSDFGAVEIDLMSPEETYQFDNGYELKVLQYFPDYELKDGEPRSKSKYPRNPAFAFQLTDPTEETSKKEVSFVGIGVNLDPTEENEFKLDLEDYETVDVSGLTVRRDYTLPIFILGAFIFMFGVIQGMYWQHRRIWVNYNDNNTLLAAHTNKNWFGLKKEIEKSIEDTSLNMVIDQEEENNDK